jgi:transposase
VLPKIVLETALSYNLNQWLKRILYLEDGDLDIDNNRAKIVIKPFFIEPKNWVSSNTAKGSEARQYFIA